MRRKPGLDVPAIIKVWNGGSVMRSWLLELAGKVFEENLNPTSWIMARAASSSRKRSRPTRVAGTLRTPGESQHHLVAANAR